jgi:hypothetical protein
MTILEAVKENIAAMEAAGIPVTGPFESDMKKYGALEIISKRSCKGRKGRVYTIFTTAEGEIGFWPLSGYGAMLGPFNKK